MPRCLPMLTSIFHRFLIDFYSQLGPPNPENSRPHCSESTIFLKSHFDVHMGFWFDFGANLAPFSLPKSMKIHPKIDPKMDQFCDRFGDGFFIDLEWILKANLGPCWPLKSIRNCPRRPQDAPKTRLGAIVSIFRRPDRILAPSWLDFGRFWASFLKVLGAQGPPRPPK